MRVPPENRAAVGFVTELEFPGMVHEAVLAAVCHRSVERDRPDVSLARITSIDGLSIQPVDPDPHVLPRKTAFP
jgi:hypothetical protein